MRIGESEEVHERSEEAPDTERPAPDSGRRPRPREQLATLPDQDFEHHDTIPAPPWVDEPIENALHCP